MQLRTITTLALALFTLSTQAETSAYGQKAPYGPRAGREPQNELVFGINPLVGFGGNATGGDIYTDLGDTVYLSGAVNYNFAVANMLQFGLNSAIAHVEGGTASATILQAAAGPTLNIPLSQDWLYNSVFLSAMFGLIKTSGATSSDPEMLLIGDLGYRLEITDHVTWRPTLSTVKVLNGAKFLFAVRLFSFSVVF